LRDRETKRRERERLGERERRREMAHSLLVSLFQENIDDIMPQIDVIVPHLDYLIPHLDVLVPNMKETLPYVLRQEERYRKRTTNSILSSLSYTEILITKFGGILPYTHKVRNSDDGSSSLVC
jgi:hypothetical protein